jgi:hypothetical protein
MGYIANELPQTLLKEYGEGAFDQVKEIVEDPLDPYMMFWCQPVY